jgi:hypothetical protein
VVNPTDELAGGVEAAYRLILDVLHLGAEVARRPPGERDPARDAKPT